MASINPSVDLSRQGDVALVTMTNPPVNAMKHEQREGLLRAFEQLRGEAGLRAVVLAGSRRAFSGGADITEFGAPPRSPILNELIAAIEDLPVPVVAAISGVALGGGLEVALGCHHRVAWEGARLGLPEVKLGILPGAGGTQRLPRVIGPEAAVRAITSGEPFTAARALELGLVEAVLDGAYPDAAVEWARGHAVAGTPRVRDREDRLAAARADRAAFDAASEKAIAATRGGPAVHACARSVANALDLPFEEGLRGERTMFQELVVTPESRAQRYAFFAEREAQKVPGLPRGTAARPVGRAAVIGAGTMGGGIAMCFAAAGIPVTLIETAQDALDRGLDRIRGNYATSVKRGSTPQAEMDRRLALIEPRLGLEAAKGADIVVEAVFEEMALKREVFGRLDAILAPGAVLATNTSYLDVDEIAATTGRPADVLGMHFFSPANVMRLLEVVRGRDTAPDVLATAVELGRRLGKVPVVVGVCDGFVGNRMLSQRTRQAERLLLEGAAPEQVDAVLTRFGFRMGPFAMADLAGLDIGWRLRKARGTTAPVADALCEAGRLGQKTGRGFFSYGADGRTPTPDPEVGRIAAEAAARTGVTQRAIGDEEILERLLFPMINEGARILEEGIAARPGDIDTIWLNGYGWPVSRGGPMHHADAVGLAHVAARLERHAEATGDESLRPTPLLRRLAEGGGTFAAAA